MGSGSGKTIGSVQGFRHAKTLLDVKRKTEGRNIVAKAEGQDTQTKCHVKYPLSKVIVKSLKFCNFFRCEVNKWQNQREKVPRDFSLRPDNGRKKKKDRNERKGGKWNGKWPRISRDKTEKEGVREGGRGRVGEGLTRGMKLESLLSPLLSLVREQEKTREKLAQQSTVGFIGRSVPNVAGYWMTGGGREGRREEGRGRSAQIIGLWRDRLLRLERVRKEGRCMEEWSTLRSNIREEKETYNDERFDNNSSLDTWRISKKIWVKKIKQV